jgi:hypothetical protein
MSGREETVAVDTYLDPGTDLAVNGVQGHSRQ